MSVALKPDYAYEETFYFNDLTDSVSKYSEFIDKYGDNNVGCNYTISFAGLHDQGSEWYIYKAVFSILVRQEQSMFNKLNRSK